MRKQELENAFVRVVNGIENGPSEDLMEEAREARDLLTKLIDELDELVTSGALSP